MATRLVTTLNSSEISRSAIEGKQLLERLFSHDDNIGAQTCFITGKSGSCKTSVARSIVDDRMINYPQDKIFWRSAMRAPLQIFSFSKPKWHIYIEKESGVRIFDRNNDLVDVTDELIKRHKLTTFNSFEDLYKKAKPGVCNAVFFKDLHLKRVKKDEGTIQWFRFIRYLNRLQRWTYVILDEYQEMVKIYRQGQLFHEIDDHTDDLTNARKCHVQIISTVQQPEQVDFRVKPNIIMSIQMHGSKQYRYSQVTQPALNAIKRPDPKIGAEGWIAEGNTFGKVLFKRVYHPSKTYDMLADIVGDYERTKVCPQCHQIYVYDRTDQVYCTRSCNERARRTRKKERTGDNTTLMDG